MYKVNQFLFGQSREGGDQIMFVSMLNDIDCFSNEIFVECEKRLVPVFQRFFPNVSFISAKKPPGR